MPPNRPLDPRLGVHVPLGWRLNAIGGGAVLTTA
jgi:hypothetical protein